MTRRGYVLGIGILLLVIGLMGVLWFPVDAQSPPSLQVWEGTTSQNQPIRVITQGDRITAWIVTIHVHGQEEGVPCSAVYTAINHGDIGTIRSGHYFTATIDNANELLIIDGQMWGQVASGWMWWSMREGARYVCEGQGELTWSARWVPPMPTPVPTIPPPPMPHIPDQLPETGIDPSDPPTPTP